MNWRILLRSFILTLLIVIGVITLAFVGVYFFSNTFILIGLILLGVVGFLNIMLYIYLGEYERSYSEQRRF